MSLIPYSISASPLGTSIYRFADVDVAAQFVPELVITATKNKVGSNVNYDLICTAPLPVDVDGVTIATNKFVGKFSFTALQSVKEDAMRGRVIDEMIDFLTVNKQQIINGSVRPVTV